MGMGFAPTWLRQVTPLLHKTTLTTVYIYETDYVLYSVQRYV